jgi:hypothetical protein
MAKRRRYIDGKVQQAIEELAQDTDWTPAQIERELRTNKEYKELVPLLPSLRTIQTIVKENRPGDESGPWSIADAEADEGLLVLPVVAAAAIKTAGERRGVTRAEARCIQTIRRVAPDLDLWAVYRLARLYLLREARREATDDLDLYLAFAPWSSPEAAKLYKDLWAPGRIPGALPFTIAERVVVGAVDGAAFELEHDQITGSREAIEYQQRMRQELRRIADEQKARKGG